MNISCSLIIADLPTVNKHIYSKSQMKKICEIFNSRETKFGTVFNTGKGCKALNNGEITHQINNLFINNFDEFEAEIEFVDTPFYHSLKNELNINSNYLDLFPRFMGQFNDNSMVDVQDIVSIDIYRNDYIDTFKKDNFYLSNFCQTPIFFSGQEWPGVEQIFQAAKALDEGRREEFRSLSAKEAKKAGKKIPIRPDWDQVKYDVMLKACRLKFKQNEEFKQKLLSTDHKKLIEGNYWHDNIWGQCQCEKCKNIIGQNLLGKILMRIRAELRMGLL